MSEPWNYQIRVYLAETLAEAAYRGDPSSLEPLTGLLQRHDATLVCQFRAFEDYVADAEAQGIDGFPLYRWTKATVEDPAMRAKHIRAFAVRVRGQEVYSAAIADQIETDLKPLIGRGLVQNLSRHDTNPANAIKVPAAYRT